MLFEFEDVTVAGRLDGVTLSIPDRGVTAVRGPSGAGKSTLLRCCNRLEAPDSGAVRYRGTDVAELDVLRHRREVGMVFQAPVLFAGTVGDNLRVAAEPSASLGDLLEQAHLDASFLEREAATLSGGEAQRVCVARALATSPHVLLMDEPTSALDADATGAIERLIGDLAGGGVPIVLVTHDAAQAGRVADHHLHLLAGRVDPDGR